MIVSLEHRQSAYTAHFLSITIDAFCSGVIARYIYWDDTRCANFAFTKVALFLCKSRAADDTSLLLFRHGTKTTGYMSRP